jgi:hypothetical protein
MYCIRFNFLKAILAGIAERTAQDWIQRLKNEPDLYIY